MNRRTFVASAAIAGLGLRAAAQSRKPRVGCQCNAFVLRNQIAALQYAGFECNNHLVQEGFAHPAETRRKLDATGLVFIAMHTSIKEIATGDNLVTMAAGGAALGCHNIVVSSEGLSPTGIFTLDALKAKCAELEKYGKIVKDHGLTLAYHNHMPEFANHDAEINALAEHTDPALVSFLIDCGHAKQGGGDPADFMRRNSHRIVGCHVKTFKDKVTQVPLGQGDFGFEDLAAAINSTHWAGWIIDEEGGGKTADSSAVGPDRSYIRKVFGV
jgi:inosose dehydratase